MALRLLIVDDSATVRAVLRRIVSRIPGLAVAGEAANGAAAVDATIELRPDVVLMDIEMPVMDGRAATERIMTLCPTPILVITSLADRRELGAAFEALGRGAIEVLAKPRSPDEWEELAAALPTAIRALAAARPARGPVAARVAAGGAPRPLRWVAVGASTGGPAAVRALLETLPGAGPAAVLLVQHIAAGFEEGLAEWLGTVPGWDVRVARDGERVPPGSVRIAPSGAHMRLAPGETVHLDHLTPARRGHRPSADDLFLSCAEESPRTSAGVLLTGMGSDGAEGLVALHRAGGLTLVQDEASSVVFGMPRAALELRAAEIALPPAEIGRALRRCWEGEGA